MAKTITLSSIGLPQKEERVLKSLLCILQEEIRETLEYGDPQTAHYVFLDLEDPEARAIWQDERQADGPLYIAVCRANPSPPSPLVTGKPLRKAAVWQALSLAAERDQQTLTPIADSSFGGSAKPATSDEAGNANEACKHLDVDPSQLTTHEPSARRGWRKPRPIGGTLALAAALVGGAVIGTVMLAGFPGTEDDPATDPEAVAGTTSPRSETHDPVKGDPTEGDATTTDSVGLPRSAQGKDTDGPSTSPMDAWAERERDQTTASTVETSSSPPKATAAPQEAETPPAASATVTSTPSPSEPATSSVDRATKSLPEQPSEASDPAPSEPSPPTPSEAASVATSDALDDEPPKPSRSAAAMESSTANDPAVPDEPAPEKAMPFPRSTPAVGSAIQSEPEPADTVPTPPASPSRTQASSASNRDSRRSDQPNPPEPISDAGSKAREGQGSLRFQTDPCKGPAARFTSTCD